MRTKRAVMLTTPQRNNINSVLHKSEEMSASLEPFFMPQWLEVIEEKESSCSVDNCALIEMWRSSELGLKGREATPGAFARDSRCAGRKQRYKQCGISGSEWWVGRRWKRRQAEGGAGKRKSCQQVLVHWESLSLCLGQVLGQWSWVLLIHFETTYKNFCLVMRSSERSSAWRMKAFIVMSLIHYISLPPEMLYVSEKYRELLMKDVIQDWAFFYHKNIYLALKGISAAGDLKP